MTNQRINQSWREQRKAIVMQAKDTDHESEFISLWQASHQIAELFDCKPATARKEIRKAIAQGVPRYGAYWKWKELN